MHADLPVFDRDFQIGLLQALLCYPDQAKGIVSAANLEEAFDGDLFRHIAHVIKAFYENPKWGHPPSLAQLQFECQTRGFNVRQSLERLYVAPENGAYYLEKADEFFESTRLRQTLLKASELWDMGQISDAKELLKIEVERKVSPNFNLGIDYFSTYTRDYSDEEARIPTLIGPLDDDMNGGLAVGELGIIVAPPGGGKSQFLVWVGQAALRSEYLAIHYTLELGADRIRRRYDACLTGIPYKELQYHSDQTARLLQHVHQKVGNTLVIKEYPTKQAEFSDIKHHIEGVKGTVGWPDLVIIDYADLLRAKSSGKDERRIVLEGIYEEMRALAQTEGVPIWTASQANRQALGMQQYGMDKIAEAFGKAMIADVVVTLGQDLVEKEKGEMHVHIAKNRNNVSGRTFRIKTDFARSRFIGEIDDIQYRKE